jgi:glycosyltransferase involved in cell wall biosynthesis
MTDDSATPLISVVIPAYGRVEPLKYTLRSAAESIAASGYAGEIIVVDDGSEPSIEEQLVEFDAHHPVRFLRQANQGSIVARMAGLREAKGRYVQFLDSDDLLHPDKIAAQVGVMEEDGLDVTYSDRAVVTLGPDYAVTDFRHSRVFLDTENSALLFAKILPQPHAPIYRTDYLRGALAKLTVAPKRMMDASGDIWLYRNLAPYPTRVKRVPGLFAGLGPHEQDRYSQCWEKLAVASLAIEEEFVANLEQTPHNNSLRTMVGEMAFRAWRTLPHDANREFQKRLLALWYQAPEIVPEHLGERSFRWLAGLIGWVNAGRLTRRFRHKSYAECKTLRNEQEFAELLSALPKPRASAVSSLLEKNDNCDPQRP